MRTYCKVECRKLNLFINLKGLYKRDFSVLHLSHNICGDCYRAAQTLDYFLGFQSPIPKTKFGLEGTQDRIRTREVVEYIAMKNKQYYGP